MSVSQVNRLINIEEVEGDLFAAPPNTLLVHACNSKGHWGKGIALAFRQNYPNAFSQNEACCKSRPTDEIPGAALLIPPADNLPKDKRHFVGCLFTSLSMGRAKDQPATILANTGPAMSDLLRQVAEWNADDHEAKVERIWMCRINSGLFNVPWDDTKRVLETVQVPEGVPSDVTVVTRT
ncbi:hypothetical protein MBLNU457_1321t1 [Dothideomycetes sp. NU457]